MKAERQRKNQLRDLGSDAADAKLHDDVSAFASQLGLTSVIQNGFNDSDFRPEMATQQIGKNGKQKKTDKASDTRQGGKQHASQHDKHRMSSHSQAGPSGRGDKAAELDAAKLDAVKGRKWNMGTGSRPGEKAGKTLVGKDEPTIWHEALKSLPALAKSDSAAAIDDWALEKLRTEGEAALDNEAKVFEQDLGYGTASKKHSMSLCLRSNRNAGKRNQADSRWLQQVKQSGTTADKLAALTLLIQESAVANVKSLDELLRWVGKRSGARGVAGQAIDALKELFTTVLLPSRRLLFFEQQALAALPAGNEGRHRLMYYYMEDAIKKRYLQFVKDLQEASRDNLAFIKEKAVKAIYDLLRSNPEQEALLLTALVDKLGDPSRKIASNAGYLLGQLLEEHPAMSLIVVQETERFLFKPYTSARAVYYAVVFLNQIVLTKRRDEGGSAVAKKLISLYFSLFKLILEGKIGQAHELQVRKEAQEAQKPGKKVVSKKKRWKERPQGQGASKATERAQAPQESQVASVDAKLLGALLAGVRRAFPFVDAADTEALMEQHSKSLFTVTHTATFGVAVQALSLVFQLLDARSAVSDRFYRALYGMLLHPELAKSNKSAMFLSLLFKAMKADVSMTRMIAFTKRLLQVASGQAPNFTCGCLLLISEVMKEKASLWTYITEPEDIDDDSEGSQEVAAQALESAELADSDAAVGAELHEGSSAASGKASKLPHQAYDMYKRDPKFSQAERTCMWELVLLAEHVHPSVSAMTKALLAGVPIDYAGDPIRDMSTSAFLDKFIQKKPKVHPKGASLMQPLAKQTPLQQATPAFAALSAADAAPDTAYFHKFFEVKAKREAAGVRPSRKRKKAKDDEEGPLGGDDDSLADSDAASDEIDDFMDNVEDSEEETGTGDYEQLAAAMAADGEPASSSDSEQEESSGEEEGNDGDDREAGSQSDGDIPEDVDVFKLAGPSDEESDSEQAEESASDDEWIMAESNEQFESEEGSEDELMLDEPDSETEASSDEEVPEKVVEKHQGKAQHKRGAAAKGSKSVFASADDYADLIAEDKPVRQPRTKKAKRK